MTTHYDDKILGNTSEWIGTNALVLAVKGDKTGTIKAIHELESMSYLESRKVRNSIEYRRKDTVDSEFNFSSLIEVFEINQDVELKEIEKIKELKTKSGKLSKRSIDILTHIQSQIDGAYIVIIRMNYQEKLGIIPHRTAQKRIKSLESIISKIMNTINTKYSQDIKLIQEFFQNHTKELRFKI